MQSKSEGKMANPQLEDGYTMIANEILEALMRVQVSPNQWQVLLCIIRKTYGFKRKVDRIANSQICQATGLGKEVVSRSLNKLQGEGFILRNGKQIGFQKDWERWRKLADQATLKVSRTTNKKLTEQSTELAEEPTKISSSHVTQNKKETFQKKLKEKIGNRSLSEELEEAWGR
jgi:phage replication O-like protein O